MPNVVFMHPDLGIGGAERLIVDAAVALKEKGHDVCIWTTHHDQQHCFRETKDGTIPVIVRGDFFPRTVFNKLAALLAYVRMTFLAVMFFVTKQQPDVIIIDQISLPIMLLRHRTPNIIFYCHFPDQLLSVPGGILKSWYRYYLNRAEEITTGMAKKIFVNSKFTAKVFMETFRSIKDRPEVLYPSIHTKKFDSFRPLSLKECLPGPRSEHTVIFLSINRFERKKDIALAIKAFALLKFRLSRDEWDMCLLIIAGGYDHLVRENIEHYAELEALVRAKGVDGKVTLLKSPSDKVKLNLLATSRCLLYTPSKEHFGIVPLEAMYMGTPVIAVNNGGPTETIIHNKTGYLIAADPSEWSQAMQRLARNPQLAKKMGEAGRKRVVEKFSFDSFAKCIDKAVKDVML